MLAEEDEDTGDRCIICLLVLLVGVHPWVKSQNVLGHKVVPC